MYFLNKFFSTSGDRGLVRTLLFDHSASSLKYRKPIVCTVLMPRPMNLPACRVAKFLEKCVIAKTLQRLHHHVPGDVTTPSTTTVMLQQLPPHRTEEHSLDAARIFTPFTKAFIST